MPKLIVVTATQLKIFRERFEQLLAQDEAEQARLREAEKHQAAELRSRLETGSNLQSGKEDHQP